MKAIDLAGPEGSGTSGRASRAVPVPPPNHTVSRLRALKAGESIVYYRGRLASDIARATIENPDYAAVLQAIAREAKRLAALGRITLSERSASRPRDGEPCDIAYVATAPAGGAS
jgi:hypothetical protein